MSYFNKFPVIEYNGKQIRDITARVALTAKSVTDIKQYQPYLLPEGMRADELAYDYYGSSSQDWLLFLANEIIDPYYGWPLEQSVFDEFITKKYGSIPIAQEGISHFQVDYLTDKTIIDSTTYDSLSASKKYYWTVDTVTELDGYLSYKRKKIESTVNTNKTIILDVSSTTGFIVDERLNQYSGQTLVGNAQVGQVINSTAVLVNKVVGTLSNGSITTTQSNKTVTITDQTLITTNISETAPDDVSIYWEPISYYDYEALLNDKKREIYAIDTGIQGDLERAVSKLLQNE